MYLRFESYLTDRDYKYRPAYARDAMRQDIEWFKDHLPSPDEDYFRLRRFGQREVLGVCWFKYQAVEMIRRAYDMKIRLEQWGYPIRVLKSRKPGRIKYQDDYQVVVNPYI